MRISGSQASPTGPPPNERRETDGRQYDALEQARKATKGMVVRIGGGPNTIQQYLRAGLIDELHLAIAPVLLGEGERPLDGLDMRALGYECTQHVALEQATHVILERRSRRDGSDII